MRANGLSRRAASSRAAQLAALLLAVACNSSDDGGGTGGDGGDCTTPAGCAQLCLDLPGDAYCSVFQSMGECAWSSEGTTCDAFACPYQVPESGQYCTLETYVCDYSESTGGAGGTGAAGGTGGGGTGASGGAGGASACPAHEATCTANGWSVVCVDP